MSVIAAGAVVGCSFNEMKSLGGGFPSGVVDLVATDQNKVSEAMITKSPCFVKFETDVWRFLPFKPGAFNFSLKLLSIEAGKVLPRSQISTSFFILFCTQKYVSLGLRC